MTGDDRKALDDHFAKVREVMAKIDAEELRIFEGGRCPIVPNGDDELAKYTLLSNYAEAEKTGAAPFVLPGDLKGFIDYHFREGPSVYHIVGNSNLSSQWLRDTFSVGVYADDSQLRQNSRADYNRHLYNKSRSMFRPLEEIAPSLTDEIRPVVGDNFEDGLHNLLSVCRRIERPFVAPTPPTFLYGGVAANAAPIPTRPFPEQKTISAKAKALLVAAICGILLMIWGAASDAGKKVLSPYFEPAWNFILLKVRVRSPAQASQNVMSQPATATRTPTSLPTTKTFLERAASNDERRSHDEAYLAELQVSDEYNRQESKRTGKLVVFSQEDLQERSRIRDEIRSLTTQPTTKFAISNLDDEEKELRSVIAADRSTVEEIDALAALDKGLRQMGKKVDHTAENVEMKKRATTRIAGYVQQMNEIEDAKSRLKDNPITQPTK